MLYKPGVVNQEEIDFIFDADIYNEDIDIREIAAIQGFYEKHGYIPDNYIVTFLNWLTYSARKNISNDLEDVTKLSFAGRCATAQSYFDLLLDKLGLDKITFNVGSILGTVPIHALTCISIPTIVNGEKTSKFFILDPTFRQFCIAEENRFERYNEEPRWGVRMSTPHPGYFFNLTDKGKDFANGLIHYGFFEVNADSLKTYFDAFSLYVTPKDAYANQNQVGLISSTATSGNDYWNRIISANEKRPCGHSFDLSTPREIVKKEDNKLLNRLRNKNVQRELDTMFEEQNIDSNIGLVNDAKKE